MKVKGKVMMVTGGGNGMGRELVLHLLKKGSKVVAVDINKTGLQETIRLAGRYTDSLMVIDADITNENVMQELPSRILWKYDAIDGVINNAGIIQPFLKINDIDFGTIDRLFRVYFIGTLNVIKAFLPGLLNRPEAHIVNVSSMGGFLPVAGQSIYGASKAAVKILSEGLTSELSDSNVNVTTVFPGAIYTNIKANSGLGVEAGSGTEGHSPDAAFSPAKAAEIIVDAIERNRTRVYIGKDSKSMNLAYKIMPNVATKLIYQKMKDKI
jgi:short-subunit dehydrogenase